MLKRKVIKIFFSREITDLSDIDEYLDSYSFKVELENELDKLIDEISSEKTSIIIFYINHITEENIKLANRIRVVSEIHSVPLLFVSKELSPRVANILNSYGFHFFIDSPLNREELTREIYKKINESHSKKPSFKLPLNSLSAKVSSPAHIDTLGELSMTLISPVIFKKRTSVKIDNEKIRESRIEFTELGTIKQSRLDHCGRYVTTVYFKGILEGSSKNLRIFKNKFGGSHESVKC